MGRIRLQQELGAALGSFQAGSWLPWDDGAEDFWEYLGWDALDIPTPECVELFAVCCRSFPLILVFLGGNLPLGSQNFPKISYGIGFSWFSTRVKVRFWLWRCRIWMIFPGNGIFIPENNPWCCGIPAFPRCFPRLCPLNPRKSLVTAPL